MTALPESEERRTVERAMAGKMSDLDARVVLCGEIHRLRDAMEVQAVTIDFIHTTNEKNERLRASLVEASEVIREDHRRLLDERGHECDLPCACVYCTAHHPEDSTR